MKSKEKNDLSKSNQNTFTVEPSLVCVHKPLPVVVCVTNCLHFETRQTSRSNAHHRLCTLSAPVTASDQ